MLGQNLGFVRTLNSQYQLLQQLGEGSGGKVYKAKNLQTQQLVALKKQQNLSKTEDQSIQLLSGKLLTHVTNILEFSKQGLEYIIVMDLADGSFHNLMQQNNNFRQSIEKQMNYFLQISQGVEELHKLGLIHRDLKPENIVYIKQQNGQYLLKLCDTGLMRNSAEKLKTIKVGTPYYMPPEQITSSTYDEKVDIWALGMILYEIISGQPMFNGNSINQLLNNINTAQQQTINEKIIGLQCPQEIKELLQKMIIIISKDRISITQVISILLEKEKQANQQLIEQQKQRIREENEKLIEQQKQRIREELQKEYEQKIEQERRQQEEQSRQELEKLKQQLEQIKQEEIDRERNKMKNELELKNKKQLEEKQSQLQKALQEKENEMNKLKEQNQQEYQKQVCELEIQKQKELNKFKIEQERLFNEQIMEKEIEINKQKEQQLQIMLQQKQIQLQQEIEERYRNENQLKYEEQCRKISSQWQQQQEQQLQEKQQTVKSQMIVCQTLLQNQINLIEQKQNSLIILDGQQQNADVVKLSQYISECLNLLQEQWQVIQANLEQLNALTFEQLIEQSKYYESRLNQIQEQSKGQNSLINEKQQRVQTYERTNEQMQREIDQKLNELNVKLQGKISQLQNDQRNFELQMKISQKSIQSCFYATPQLKQLFNNLYDDQQKYIAQIEGQIQYSKTKLQNKEDQIQKTKNSILQIETSIIHFEELNGKLQQFNKAHLWLKEQQIYSMKQQQEKLLSNGDQYLQSFYSIEQTDFGISSKVTQQKLAAAQSENKQLEQLFQKIQQIQLSTDQSDDLLNVSNQTLIQLHFDLETKNTQVKELINQFQEAVELQREEQKVQIEAKAVKRSLIEQMQLQDKIQNLANQIKQVQQRIQKNNQELKEQTFMNQTNEYVILIQQEELNLKSLERQCQNTFEIEKITTQQQLICKQEQFKKEINNFLKRLEQHQQQFTEFEYQVTQALNTLLNQQDQEVAQNYNQLQFYLQNQISKHNSNWTYLKSLNTLEQFSILKEGTVENEIQVLKDEYTQYINQWKQSEEDRYLIEEEFKKIQRNSQNESSAFQQKIFTKQQNVLLQLSQQLIDYINELTQQLKQCEEDNKSIKNYIRLDFNQLVQKLQSQMESEESKLKFYKEELAKIKQIFESYQESKSKAHLDELKNQQQKHNNSYSFKVEYDFESEWSANLDQLKREKKDYQLCKCYLILNKLFNLERLCKRRLNNSLASKRVKDGSTLNKQLQSNLKEKQNDDMKELNQILQFIQEQRSFFKHQSNSVLSKQSDYDIDLTVDINEVEIKLNMHEVKQQNIIKSKNLVKLRSVIKNQDAIKKIQNELMPNFEGERLKLFLRCRVVSHNTIYKNPPTQDLPDQSQPILTDIY